MADDPRADEIIAAVALWARSRADILGLALVGSRACGTARLDSDIDLVVLAAEPQVFRDDEAWLAEIPWSGAHVAVWHDADYAVAWSRHAVLNTGDEIEFTFCEPSWAATDPIDAGTLGVVSGGCHVVLDKAKLFESLLMATAP
jgi:uncharacterized protein